MIILARRIVLRNHPRQCRTNADVRKARFCSFEERQKRGDTRLRRPHTGSVYTPAAGRLAAAIATISASRRPIRHLVERNNEFRRRMSIIPAVSAEAFGQGGVTERMGIRRARVEPAVKIATLRPSMPTWQQIHCCDGGRGEENLLRPASGKTGLKREAKVGSLMPIFPKFVFGTHSHVRKVVGTGEHIDSSAAI